jgi:hypothetical protein
MNSKPTIFLDVDGVMATSHQYYTNKKNWHPMYDCYRFDEGCVKIFNSILGVIDGAIVVISSDWRDDYTIEQFNEIFKWNGINAVISGYTPSSWGHIFRSMSQLDEARSYEILKYVEEHKITNWVAIDDLNLSQWIPDNFVRCTRVSEGLKQKGVKDKILNIINLKQ